MSKEVKRYDPFGYDGLSALMHEDVLGDYVSWDDYDALRLLADEQAAAVTALNKHAETLTAERDALLAERDAAQKDAERYRWLRMADWWNSPLCVIRDPKQQAKPGTDCPSRDRLDEAIDAAQQGAQP